MRRLLFVFVFLVAGCGSSGPVSVESPVTAEGPAGESAFRLRHQIMAKHGDDVHVFEGYMILQGDAFVVRAFAGPGVDLFTVVRDGSRHIEEAHLTALEGKLDLEAVGLDIARAYFGCSKSKKSDADVGCTLLGFDVEETYLTGGELAKRYFPKAYEGGLLVEYSDFMEKLGRSWAKKITLVWGDGGNEMVIRLLEVEALPHQDMSSFFKAD